MRTKRATEGAELENRQLIDHSNGEPIDEGDSGSNPSSADETPVWGFFIIGFISLLCYNFFLQVIGFLSLKTGASFISAAPLAYGIFNNVGQLLCIFLGPSLPWGPRFWFSTTVVGIVGVGYSIIAVPGCSVGFKYGIGVSCLLGLGNAVFQSAAFGLAGLSGARAMNYMNFGQSFAGVLTLPLLLLLKRLFRWIARAEVASQESGISGVISNSILAGFALVSILTFLFIPYYSIYLSKTATVRRAQDAAITSIATGSSDRRSIMIIIWQTLPLALMVWLVLLVTFLVFPGIVLSWEPNVLTKHLSKGTYKACLIYCFQVFDAVGKLSALVGLSLSPLLLKIFSPWRIMLGVCFFASTTSLAFISNDWTRFFLVAFLAFTNGLMITWCMIWGSSQVRKSEVDVASYTMSFFLVFGIACGSFIAYGLNVYTTIQQLPLEWFGMSELDHETVVFSSFTHGDGPIYIGPPN